MEFIDTVDLEEIRDAVDHLPIVGVTSNPSGKELLKGFLWTYENQKNHW